MTAPLVDVREKLKLNQEQMAERLGINQGHLSRIERGISPMTYRIAAAYSRVTRKARSYFEEMIPNV